MRRRRVPVRALIVALLPSAALGHHSYLQYGQEVREIRGELLSVRWINPHPTLSIRVAAGEGESAGETVGHDAGASAGQDAGASAAQAEGEIWLLESFSSPYVLSRMGVTIDDFVVGSQVTVAGRISRRNPNQVLLTHLRRQDGTEVIVAANGKPFWTDEPVGGSANWVETSIATAAAENRGFFRVWSLDRIGAGSNVTPFTAEAIAARESFDEAGSYVENCESPGMPTAMMAAFPFDLVDEGDRIRLHTEYHDIVRTIHMSADVDPEDQPASRLGFSVGRWEDDGRSLVVETTRIDWPWFDMVGTPQSPAVRIAERFTLSEDQASLAYRRVVEDPATFTEPAVAESTYLALGETIQTFDCRAQ